MSDAVSPVLFRAADRPGPAAVGPGMGEEALELSMDAPSPHAVHKVGPNAVIQTRLALIDICGAKRARALFAHAGVIDWFDLPPDSMVPAEPVNRLNMTLFQQLDRPVFEMLMADAGTRTGHYILDNRIPRPVRKLLENLPAWLAAQGAAQGDPRPCLDLCGKCPGHCQAGPPRNNRDPRKPYLRPRLPLA